MNREILMIHVQLQLCHLLCKTVPFQKSYQMNLLHKWGIHLRLSFPCTARNDVVLLKTYSLGIIVKKFRNETSRIKLAPSFHGIRALKKTYFSLYSTVLYCILINKI